MPRHGSRAQLIHILAREDALNYSWAHGHGPPQAAFHDGYWNYSHAELEALVADAHLAPRRRGRPKKFWTDAELIAEVNRRRSQHSERRACELVARSLGLKPLPLRMRYRRALARK